jgi:hypothetical protein
MKKLGVQDLTLLVAVLTVAVAAAEPEDRIRACVSAATADKSGRDAVNRMDTRGHFLDIDARRQKLGHDSRYLTPGVGSIGPAHSELRSRVTV